MDRACFDLIADIKPSTEVQRKLAFHVDLEFRSALCNGTFYLSFPSGKQYFSIDIYVMGLCAVHSSFASAIHL